jgi:CO dehydrogenase maturation factor
MVVGKKVVQCSKTGVVFNKVVNNSEILSQSAEKIGVDVIGFLPQDPEVTDYDFNGRSLTELPNNTPALMAVREIMDKLL